MEGLGPAPSNLRKSEPNARSHPNPRSLQSDPNAADFSRQSEPNAQALRRKSEPKVPRPVVSPGPGARDDLRPNRQVRRRYYRDPGGRLTHNFPDDARISGNTPSPELTWPGKAARNGPRTCRKTAKTGRFPVESGSESAEIGENARQKLHFAGQSELIPGRPGKSGRGSDRLRPEHAF